MKYVIVGGGIAGVSAAKAIREQDAAGEIMIYSNEFHPLGLYARKDMAQRFATRLDTPEDFLLESPASLARLGIQFQYHPILRLFPKQRQVLKPHHLRRSYDRLLLALGSTPRLVNAPGLHYIGVHQVRSYEDIALIEAWLPELMTRGAVVIGGGLLGLDMVYALRKRGVPTTLVVREAAVGVPLLPEQAGHWLEQQLRRDGVKVILNQTLQAYLSHDERMLDAIQLQDGRVIPTRMALCAVGVQPQTALVEGTGIVIDPVTGAICVNEHMQTTIPEVYAAGGCALVQGNIAHNWMLSAAQGRIAGLNMAGQAINYLPERPGDFNTQIYNLPLAYFGRFESTNQAWTWIDGQMGFAQVNIEDGMIIGAILLGTLAKCALPLLERAQQSNPVTLDEVKVLVAGDLAYAE